MENEELPCYSIAQQDSSLSILILYLINLQLDLLTYRF